ncbi:hypothetical protein ANN_06310, partial [Periplaneta americana]
MIYCSLKEFIQVLTRKEDWKNIEYGFRNHWNFPDCMRALNGKHVVIKAPPGSGSEHYNFKSDYSVALLGLVDSDYCFQYIDVGAKGRGSDEGIFFQNSSLFAALETNSLNLPLPPNVVIVGDDEFPLKPYLMKPCSR